MEVGLWIQRQVQRLVERQKGPKEITSFVIGAAVMAGILFRLKRLGLEIIRIEDKIPLEEVN